MVTPQKAVIEDEALWSTVNLNMVMVSAGGRGHVYTLSSGPGPFHQPPV